MTRGFLRIPLVVGLVVALSAAIGGIVRAASTISLVGTWTGSGSDSLGAEGLTWVLTQSGNTVTGTARMTANNDGSCASCHKSRAAGTFAGTITGNRLSFQLLFPAGNTADPTPICDIVLSGTVADITRSPMAATYTGTDSCEPPLTGGTMQMTSATLAPGSQPTDVVGTASGSGLVLTWRAPATLVPTRYVVTGGTSDGRIDQTVIVTPDTTPRYTIPAVPPGTYLFRVRALHGDGLGLASDPARVVAGGSSSSTGPPTALTASASGSTVTLTWVASGGTPTSYQVEGGSAPGSSDLGVIATAATRLTAVVPAGTYYARVRAVSGGAISAPSNEVSVAVGVAACAAAPATPVLLPAVARPGGVTLSWVPAATGAPAERYQLEAVPASGSPFALLTVGTGTSVAGPVAAGTYAVRVVAVNACGSSPASNEITFTP